MPQVRNSTYYGSRCDPFGQPPLLYPFEVLRGISLALERHHAAIDASDNIRASTLREDTSVNVNSLAIWQGINVLKYRNNYRLVF